MFGFTSDRFQCDMLDADALHPRAGIEQEIMAAGAHVSENRVKEFRGFGTWIFADAAA